MRPFQTTARPRPRRVLRLAARCASASPCGGSVATLHGASAAGVCWPLLRLLVLLRRPSPRWAATVARPPSRPVGAAAASPPPQPAVWLCAPPAGYARSSCALKALGKAQGFWACVLQMLSITRLLLCADKEGGWFHPAPPPQGYVAVKAGLRPGNGKDPPASWGVQASPSG